MLGFLYTLIILPLVNIIEFIFMLSDDIFRNVGVSVIMLSVGVSILCLPLYMVAESWAEKERLTTSLLSKQVGRIKACFSGDEQYMMLSAFYRESHYHPLMSLRSSFGLLIQIPFFIAAYAFLSKNESLAHKSFLFIRDLSLPDGILGLNLLPIVMTAINIVAGLIYSRGHGTRENVQMLVLALVFLVILYPSPSGLVIYWTMNNVFSLVKNIFYKLKNPRKVLVIMLVFAILSLDIYLIFFHNGPRNKRILLSAIALIVLFVPVVLLKAKTFLMNTLETLTRNFSLSLALYSLSMLSLALLFGVVIPTILVNSSVVEFTNIDNFASPFPFILKTSVEMFGLFVLWGFSIFLLFGRKVRSALAFLSVVAFLSALVNAFLFSGNYPTLSRVLTFSLPLEKPSPLSAALNIFSILLIIVLAILFFRAGKVKIILSVLGIILTSETCISVVNLVKIGSEYEKTKAELSHSITSETEVLPIYHFTKTGRNVVVLMLDKAENAYIEPIFRAFPALKDCYSGFTLYRNVASFNEGTLLAAPALFGGYEYTPLEMNKRSTEKLVSKHNEALLVMPRIFTEQANFHATCADLSWANYTWIPDMSICLDYENIDSYNSELRYTSLWLRENPGKVRENITSSLLFRNLPWFSLFKCSPLVIRESLYDDGHWWGSDRDVSDTMEFIDYYSALEYLPKMTDFSGEQNQFFSIVSSLTHSSKVLAPPEYTPRIETSPYEYQNESEREIASYKDISVNISALRLVSLWLKLLKDNGCYGNTRIIIVSDHGIGSVEGERLSFKNKGEFFYNGDHLHPLLMVKDFDSEGEFQVNDTFMTNADVPDLATSGVVKEPFNPATKKKIEHILPSEKVARGVILERNWRPGGNGINTFTLDPRYIYTISRDVRDYKNWEHIAE